jgi:probable phosphoglycerate mutase
MRQLALEARDLAAQISAAGGSVSFTWIPRERNKDADALSNDGMDGRTIDRMVGDDVSRDDESVAEVVDEVIDPAPTPVPSGPWEGTPTRIVLIRHGVTDFTVASRLDGRGGADPSLNTTGQAQAAAAGRATAHLLGGSSARVVTSSLARARQTGAAVAEAIGAEPSVDADWDEQDFGDWDGASIPDLVRDEADALTALRVDAAYARPGGESHDELAARVVAAFERVVAAGGTTVVVCHRKPIMCVLAHVLGIPHDKVWRLAAAPGSLTALEVWPDGNVSVAFTNRT